MPESIKYSKVTCAWLQSHPFDRLCGLPIHKSFKHTFYCRFLRIKEFNKHARKYNSILQSIENLNLAQDMYYSLQLLNALTAYIIGLTRHFIAAHYCIVCDLCILY